MRKGEDFTHAWKMMYFACYMYIDRVCVECILQSKGIVLMTENYVCYSEGIVQRKETDY